MNEQFITPAIIGEQIAGRTATVRKILSSLATNITAATFDVAELLYEAKINLYYRAWGFESLYDYAWRELGIKQRKAHYLVRIVQVCRAMNIPRKDYELVGVTKLKEITRLEPEDYWFNPETKTNEPVSDHILNLFSNAFDMTAEQIEEEVKKLKGEVGDESMVWMPAFPVKKSVRDRVILPAMELCRKMLGSAGRDKETGTALEYSNGAVFEIICADFLVGNIEVEDTSNDLVEPEATEDTVRGSEEQSRKELGTDTN